MEEGTVYLLMDLVMHVHIPISHLSKKTKTTGLVRMANDDQFNMIDTFSAELI